jgi:hypothetical protein
VSNRRKSDSLGAGIDSPPGPFRVLIRHALARIFPGGERSGSGEVDLGLGVLLGMLALPGVFASLFLIDKYGSLFQGLTGVLNFDPYAASLPDEYFFIALSMVVSASVAVWKWDSLLPDRRDYNNLGALPIPTRNFLQANLIAVAILAVILSLDVNAASTLLFPAVVSNSRSSFPFFARFTVAHFACVFSASVFGFLIVLCALGLPALLLPTRVFNRVSLYLRFVIVVALLALLASAFAVGPQIGRSGNDAHHWLARIPPVWFVGLSQVLLGRSTPEFIFLANRGVIASGSALLVAIAAYSLSCHRLLGRSEEAMGDPGNERNFLARSAFAVADATLLRSPFQRAGFRFVFKTLSRGSDQSLAFGWFVGLGVVVASQSLVGAARGSFRSTIPSADFLAVPLALIYFLALGLRTAFEIPINLRGNWIFRMTLDPDANECVALARRVMWAFIVPPLIFIGLPVYAHFWGPKIAVFHVAIVTVSSAILIETFLMRFRKVPFTCSVPAFKNTALVAILMYLLGFFAFSELIAALEHAAFTETFYGVFLVIAFGIAALILWVWRKSLTYLERQPIFEDAASTAISTIDLDYRL